MQFNGETYNAEVYNAAPSGVNDTGGGNARGALPVTPGRTPQPVSMTQIENALVDLLVHI